jgi:aconitate hydratase 2/2-methylisocitrate dehydratase
MASSFLTSYNAHVAERAVQGIVPLPLDAMRTAELVGMLEEPPVGEEEVLLDLLTNRVPPGVDEAAYVKAGFLSAISKGKASCPLITDERAIELLGTMQGGYNIQPLIDALDDPRLGGAAASALSATTLVFDSFNEVEKKAQAGNTMAQHVIQSWADATWFTGRPEVPDKLTLTVFKVPGETNTDDLSPAPDAWSRPDIPLHALAMLKFPREGITDSQAQIVELKKKGFPLAYVGDVVGTGSSRKSATNSVLWYMGNDMPYIPNKRTGGVCIGGKIAPIFFNTMEDSGSLPLEMDVASLAMGDVIEIYPYEGVVKRHGSDEVLTTFALKTEVILDEVRAGGRIPLIIGRGLTSKARASLGLPASDVFRSLGGAGPKTLGYTLAQKMVGRACGVQGVAPGEYCEPRMTTVGSQDTTGPMTRDELKDLACLGFSADLVMQSFCHTAAYPKPVDVKTHHTLPDFIMNRAGVSLRPGDGIIHSWLNRMLLPDTVGTGGDSHTRFPIGISFPAGSGLVAFAAAAGVMPLDMPESVLVRFSGELQPGITLRDLVHAIPYAAKQRGLLTVEKQGKVNVFSGRVLEIEGLGSLKCEQAFELSDASAERSAAGCTIKLDRAPIEEYLRSNITMLKWMIAEGYGEVKTIERRIASMENWLEAPQLMEADPQAEYHETIEIDMSTITQPILCAPNDPDDAVLLSDVAGEKIDEVFIGSCMTNIGHFRAAGKMLNSTEGSLPTRLWVAPPTKMDAAQLTSEGYYAIYGRVGARTEMPGCSLCMGNQARVADKATVVSTSTRNFPNRLGKGANVYLASAELATVAATAGRLPTPAEYLEQWQKVDATAADTYRYLNFHTLSTYMSKAHTITLSPEMVAAAKKLQGDLY